MWFIIMMIGIYICYPLFKAIIRYDECKYFLILAFVFASVLPEATILAYSFENDIISFLFDTVQFQLYNMNLYMVLGFSGFFILGYYLDNNRLSKRKRLVIYLTGILSLAITIILRLSGLQGKMEWYGYFSVNIVFEAIAVFTFFKYCKYNPKYTKLIVKLSKISFAAYLVHALVIEQVIVNINIDYIIPNLLLQVIIRVIIAIAMSFAIAAFVNSIPILRKYIT